MNDEHAALLRTALKLEDGADLPQNVIDTYWDLERTARRLRATIDRTALLMIVMIARGGSPPDPDSFLDEVPAMKRGDRVLAKFRNQWKWGKFVAVEQATKRIIVELDQDCGSERNFQPTGVRKPTKEELVSIGE
jgi:hypothetical protein